MTGGKLILGVSGLYHDAAAALVCGDTILAAAQEERFSREKHDWRFPSQAIAYCLRNAPDGQPIDAVANYENPKLKMERMVRMGRENAPRGAASWPNALAAIEELRTELPASLLTLVNDPGKIVFCSHHRSHAASAFYPSPFDQAAIIVADGVGEWSTVSIWRGDGNVLEPVRELQFPHSLGMLYSAFTQYCGFKVNSGEYKLMGLAPFGMPVFRDMILEKVLDLKPDGSFALDLQLFEFHTGLSTISPLFADLFGQPARAPEEPLTAHHMNIAASIQAVTDEIMLRLAETALRLTGIRNLCLAGGVALNCVSNSAIVRKARDLDGLWVQPAAGDAGGALGAAMAFARSSPGSSTDSPRSARPAHSSFLGPSFSDDAIAAALKKSGLSFETYSPDDLAVHVTTALSQGDIVGHFHGRMEFGPRALGNRSILADPRPAGMLDRVNRQIKFREGWRPFAPIILADVAAQYFEEPNESPFMLMVSKLRDAYITGPTLAEARSGGETRLPQLQEAVSTEFGAATHVDHTARIQTVDANSGTRAYNILRAFHALTDCPMLLNTSFNVRGEPIVCTPRHAIDCFLNTHLDLLVIGSHIVRRRAQESWIDEHIGRRAFRAD
jgi:carbamoyltransferase